MSELATVYAAIRAAAQSQPERTALVHVETGDARESPRSLSYSQLLRGITRAANGLRALGADSSCSVATMLPSVPESQLALWGAATASVALPLNPLLNVDSTLSLLRAARARVLVCPGPSLQAEWWHKAQALRALYPELACVVYVDEHAAEVRGSVRWRDLIAAQAEDRLTFSPAEGANSTAALFHTGGTTGAPRLVRHTHGNQLAAARGFVSMAELKAGDVMANGFPLFHVAGADVSSIRVGYSGGAAVPRAAALAFEAATGKPLREVYGMTESAGVITVDPIRLPRELGCAGMPAPGMRCETWRRSGRGELLSRCGPDEVGVLVVHGAQVSPGYVDVAQGADTFSSDGGLITGDLARVAEDGRVTVVGRSKDLIIRSGHNLDPVVIEEALLSHPAVASAAAVAEPDGYAGELPVCYVALRPGHSVAAEELQEHARAILPERPAWPKRIAIVDALPLTVVGKVYKPALRADAIKHALAMALASLLEADVQVEDEPGAGLVALIPRPAGERERAAIEGILQRYVVRWRWQTGP